MEPAAAESLCTLKFPPNSEHSLASTLCVLARASEICVQRLPATIGAIQKDPAFTDWSGMGI